ncbi:ArsR family metal-binding transcriptional regulator [Nocardia sp. GAS34]
MIRQVLPCIRDDSSLRPCPGVLDTLRARLDDLDQRADELTRARHMLRATIATTERAAGRERTPSNLL